MVKANTRLVEQAIYDGLLNMQVGGCWVVGHPCESGSVC